MKRRWKFIYLGGAILSVWSGFSSLASERTADTNADWILVAVVFVVMCFFPLGTMAYSRSEGIETFRRPSLDRQPLGWWRDPLQPLRVSLISISLFLVGACFALFRTDHKVVMIFWVYAALTVGLFIGERIVYRIYKNRIT